MKGDESMKEHPIIFSGEMVRAILAGHKTQTRRVIRPQPQGWDPQIETDGITWAWCIVGDHDYSEQIRCCPYGQPGDTLWVRESACYAFDCDGDVDGICAYRADVDPLSDWHKYKFIPGTEAADWNGHTGWRPSIHMPRWAARLTLEATGVRVERIQDISEEDVLAEGCGLSSWGLDQQTGAELGLRTAGFAELWDSINARRGFGWDTNSWVWVIEFKVKERGSK